jgi:hypothetical protein
MILLTELNHVPTSSASGTWLYSSVVERWTLKLKVPRLAIQLVTFGTKNRQNCSLSHFIICQPLYLICLFVSLWR